MSQFVRQFSILCILFITVSSCPSEPTDFVLVVKASYYLTEDQWTNVKSLATKIAKSVDVGRTKSTSQISIALFDNLNEPKFAIGLGSYGRSTDLTTAIQKLKLLPCGSWCGEQTQKSDEEQISTLISKQNYSRLTKVFIITSHYVDINNLQTTLSSNAQVLLQQVVIPQTQGIVTYDQPYYNYYRAYYDQYRRYAGRYEQMYPYVSVGVPSDQYPYASLYFPGQESYTDENWSSWTCFNLIGCQECLSPTTLPKTEQNTDTQIEIVTVNSGDSHQKPLQLPSNELLSLPTTKSGTSSTNLSSEKPKSTITEDYEYEITADPPGMKINKTPLLDEVNERSISDGELVL